MQLHFCVMNDDSAGRSCLAVGYQPAPGDTYGYCEPSSCTASYLNGNTGFNASAASGICYVS